MRDQLKKHAPVALLKALIAGHLVKIGDQKYSLAGDVLDLAVLAGPDVHILTMASFRQFMALAHTMTQAEIIAASSLTAGIKPKGKA